MGAKNIAMIEMLRVSNAKEAVVKNITNIKMNNIKMMNIIIKLKTRIKKKTNKMMVKRNKTTDKKLITVVKSTNVGAEVVTERKRQNNKSMKVMKIMALNCQKKNQNSIESRMINTHQKTTNKLHMMKKMKFIIRSLNKEKLNNPTEALKEGPVAVAEEKGEAEEEGEAEAKKNTCQRIESREKVVMTILRELRATSKKKVKTAKDTNKRTSTMIMITLEAMVSRETNIKAVVVAKEVGEATIEVEEATIEAEAVMAKNITRTNNKEKAQLEEINSESDINRIQNRNLLSLKTESSPSTLKTTKILPQRQSSKNNRPIDSLRWVTYSSE